MKKEKSKNAILDKAKKLKALADRGIGGEKKNAQASYEEYVNKHNIEEEDINPSNFNRVFRLKSRDYAVLLSHIIIAVNPYSFIDKKKGEYSVVLDEEDYIEVTERVEAFYREFNREKALFLSAFMERFSEKFIADEQAIHKHSLIAQKMQEDAEKLYRKNNPDKQFPVQSEVKDDSRKEVEIIKPELPTITERDANKIQLYIKHFDNVRYTKANRRIGNGEE